MKAALRTGLELSPPNKNIIMLPPPRAFRHHSSNDECYLL
jgi:hypothetical protein